MRVRGSQPGEYVYKEKLRLNQKVSAVCPWKSLLPSQTVAKLPSVHTEDEKNAVEDNDPLSIQPSQNTPGEMFVTCLYFWNRYHDKRCTASEAAPRLICSLLEKLHLQLTAHFSWACFTSVASSTLFHTPTLEQQSETSKKKLYSSAGSNLIYALLTSTTKQKKNPFNFIILFFFFSCCTRATIIFIFLIFVCLAWSEEKWKKKMIGNLEIVGRGVCKGEWWQWTSTVLIKITW